MVTAPDPAGTPDSRSGTVTAGQAAAQRAYEAFWTRESGFVVTPWDELPPSEREAWWAAIAAAAPAPAGELATLLADWRKTAASLKDRHGTGDARERNVLEVVIGQVEAITARQPQDAPGADAAAPTCPCCSAIIRHLAFEDGSFCWSCGLYRSDDPAACDNEDHHPGPTITETAP